MFKYEFVFLLGAVRHGPVTGTAHGWQCVWHGWLRRENGSVAAGRFSARHSVQRSRRSLGTTEQHTRLNRNGAFPGGQFRVTHLGLRLRIGIEVAVAVMATH